MATYDVTPLMMACQNNNAKDVAHLISKGENVNSFDSTNRTALFYCSENTDTSCIEQLYKAKVNLNHQDKFGYSCLHVAVMCGNSTIVDYLINNGADVNITDSEMHSVIHWSVVCGQFNIFDYLITKNADPETADIHGAYPIHYAAQMCGKIDMMDDTVNRDHLKSILILKKLIELKVKIDVEDFDQRNAIIWAASSGMHNINFFIFIVEINFNHMLKSLSNQTLK
jgi:ankyrin repeat protein